MNPIKFKAVAIAAMLGSFQCSDFITDRRRSPAPSKGAENRRKARKAQKLARKRSRK